MRWHDYYMFRITAYCAQQRIPLCNIWLGKNISFNFSGGLHKGVLSNFLIHSR